MVLYNLNSADVSKEEKNAKHWYLNYIPNIIAIGMEEIEKKKL